MIVEKLLYYNKYIMKGQSLIPKNSECPVHIYRLDKVQFPEILALYNKARDNYWIPQEYPLDKDKHDLERLTPMEQRYLLMTLGFFSSAEGWVGQNILEISKHIFNTEARMFLGYQLMEEMKHVETFRYIIDGLGLKPEDIYDMHETTPEIQAKRDFETKHLQVLCVNKDESSLVDDIFVYYAILEGLFFFSGFIVPLSFGQRGVLKNVSELVRWILKDETRHLAFGIEMLKKYDLSHKRKKFKELMEEAVEIETAYAKAIMKEPIVGLSFETYSKYVRYLADRRMRALGLESIYHEKNPMKWAVAQSDLPNLTNFFEAKVDY